ncbi:uncharacterized protein LOC102805809, partial [Saccoglossus kowalevskii]|uniref:Uncharacterized protein LOC102805809 n=1 Tax=Saccoglossus kowalevskii TaxID=10224 RepID=A0ABM0MH90_SACKO
IMLLLCSGCLGCVAGKVQSECVIVSYLVLSTLTFLVSSIAVVQCAILIYIVVGEDVDGLEHAYGSTFTADFSLADAVTSPLIIYTLTLICSLGGFIFGLFSMFIACKAACTRSKIDTLRQGWA